MVAKLPGSVTTAFPIIFISMPLFFTYFLNNDTDALCEENTNRSHLSLEFMTDENVTNHVPWRLSSTKSLITLMIGQFFCFNRLRSVFAVNDDFIEEITMKIVMNLREGSDDILALFKGITHNLIFISLHWKCLFKGIRNSFKNHFINKNSTIKL